MSAFFEDEEEEEEIPQDQDTDSEGAGWCGVIPLENIPISIVGKAPKKRRKGKQVRCLFCFVCLFLLGDDALPVLGWIGSALLGV